MLFLLATVAISEGTKNASDVWLSIWSDNGGGPGGALILLYIAIGVLFGSLLYVVSRILMGQRGSRVLHEQCVVALLRAQMKFFDQTPSGQILNRLAEDTNILDYRSSTNNGGELRLVLEGVVHRRRLHDSGVVLDHPSRSNVLFILQTCQTLSSRYTGPSTP